MEFGEPISVHTRQRGCDGGDVDTLRGGFDAGDHAAGDILAAPDKVQEASVLFVEDRTDSVAT